MLSGAEVGENDFGLLNPLFGREGGRAASYYRTEVVLEGGGIDLKEAGKIESVVREGLGVCVRVGITGECYEEAYNLDDGVLDVGPVEQVLRDCV